MSRRDEIRRVEELLARSAGSARVGPSPAFRGRVRAALERKGSPSLPAPWLDLDDPARNLRRIVGVNVVVLLLGGLGVAAVAGWFSGDRGATSPAQSGPRRDAVARLAPEDAAVAAARAQDLTKLATDTPRALGEAVDAPLLAELDHIAADASSAARFLLGRLPAPLLELAPDGSRR